MQLCTTNIQSSKRVLKHGELEPAQRRTLIQVFNGIKRYNLVEVLSLLLTVYQRNNADDPRIDKIMNILSDMK